MLTHIPQDRNTRLLLLTREIKVGSDFVTHTHIVACYNPNMSKLPLISLVVMFLALTALLGLSIYQYNHERRPVSVQTVQQAENRRRAAEQQLREHDAVNTAAINNANKQLSELLGQKNTLCAQIRTAKLAQPLCQ